MNHGLTGINQWMTIPVITGMYTNYRLHSTDREITCTSCMTIKLILFKSYNKMLSLVVYAGVNVLVARISGKFKTHDNDL